MYPIIHGVVMPSCGYRNKYNYDRDAVSDLSGTKNVDKSLTVQSEADDADINKIVAKFIKTGLMPVNPRSALTDEFVEPVDYRSALDAIRKAEEMFMEYPADVRKKFDNDPGKFLEFTANKDNLEEMYKMGLAIRPEAIEPTLVRIENLPAGPAP